MVAPTYDMAAGVGSKHILPNGSIDGNPVAYLFTHALRPTSLDIRFATICEPSFVRVYASIDDGTFQGGVECVELRETEQGSGSWETSLGGFTTPNWQVCLYFVVGKNGQQADNATAPHRWVLSEAPSPTDPASQPPGPTDSTTSGLTLVARLRPDESLPELGADQIAVQLVNQGQKIRDDQIYFAVIGRDPKTQIFSYLKPDGTMVQCSLGDNGALTKGGQRYTNYFWRLSESKTLVLPKMDSGRIFVSITSPMYIQINVDVNGQIGFTGPNTLNPTDPNLDVIFDWYEFTYNHLGLWVNTTQVDQFGIPLTVECFGPNFRQKVGTTEPRESIFQAFAEEVPKEFRGLVQGHLRISAPCKSQSFLAAGPYHNYMAAYVKEMWEYFQTHTLTINMWENTRRFEGKVIGGDVFEFTEVPSTRAYVGGKFYIRGQPTTQEVFEGSGVLATGNVTELAIQAQVCAALNRHVMDDGAKWQQPKTFYPRPGGTAPAANYYAEFWHKQSIGGKAYGFAYDDVSEQSSTIHTPTPQRLVLGVGF